MKNAKREISAELYDAIMEHDKASLKLHQLIEQEEKKDFWELIDAEITRSSLEMTFDRLDDVRYKFMHVEWMLDDWERKLKCYIPNEFNKRGDLYSWDFLLEGLRGGTTHQLLDFPNPYRKRLI